MTRQPSPTLRWSSRRVAFVLTPVEGADTGILTLAVFTDPGGAEGMAVQRDSELGRWHGD